jgi:3-deoxy-D-manno-octulosonate 8-phosphate phosphatase (KDO 8-P phosphatase)
MNLANSALPEVELHHLAHRIQLLLMDVDGTLTDGKIHFAPDAQGRMTETKAFDAQDGIALRWLAWHKIKTGVISGRDSAATVERARQVEMTYVFQGHVEKIPILEQIVADSGLHPTQIAYVGDDLTDVVIMRRVGLAIATANARPEVKSVAHCVTSLPGGSGAVREAVELILRAKGLWQGILEKYEVTR